MVAIYSVQVHSNAGNEQLGNVKIISVFQKLMVKQSVLNNSPDIVMLWLIMKGKYTSQLPNHVHISEQTQPEPHCHIPIQPVSRKINRTKGHACLSVACSCSRREQRATFNSTCLDA